MKFKIISIICVITLLFNLKVKTNSGLVTYSFKENDRDSIKATNNKEYYKVFDYLNKAAKDITFSLTFNQSESFFEVNKKMDSDLGSRVMSYAENIITKGKYYYNKNDDYLYTEAKIYDSYTLIKTKPSEVKWTITKETKKIGEFDCLKATCIKKIENNNQEMEVEIIAWFTPEIPLSYGPLEFNNLPGLILEVKAANFTFYAINITLNKEEIEIKKLNSKRIISLEEHIENFKKIDKN